ncbi:hypothetical protein [Streptomyces sp. B6B3]
MTTEAPPPDQPGGQATGGSAEELRRKVREANQQSEANRLSRGGR